MEANNATRKPVSQLLVNTENHAVMCIELAHASERNKQHQTMA